MPLRGIILTVTVILLGIVIFWQSEKKAHVETPAENAEPEDPFDTTGWFKRWDEPQSVLVEASPGFTDNLPISNALKFGWESQGLYPAVEHLAKRVAFVRAVYEGRDDYESLGTAIAFGPECSYFLTVSHVIHPSEIVENRGGLSQPEWEPYPPRFADKVTISLRGGVDDGESQCRIAVEPQLEQPIYRLVGGQAVVFSCLDESGERVSAIQDPQTDSFSIGECEKPLPLPDTKVDYKKEEANPSCTIIGFPTHVKKHKGKWAGYSALCPDGKCMAASAKVATFNCPVYQGRLNKPSHNTDRLLPGDSDHILAGACQVWPGNSGGPLACVSEVSEKFEIMGLAENISCNDPEPSELEEGCLAPWYGMDVPDRFIYSRREAESKNPAAMALFVPVIREQIRSIEQRKASD